MALGPLDYYASWIIYIYSLYFSGVCTNFTLRLAIKARSRSLGPLHPSFNVARILRDALHEVLPDNAHEICSGKLHISLTRISDRQAVLVSEYESKAELIQVHVCSILWRKIDSTKYSLTESLVCKISSLLKYLRSYNGVKRLTPPPISIHIFCGNLGLCILGYYGIYKSNILVLKVKQLHRRGQSHILGHIFLRKRRNWCSQEVRGSVVECSPRDR